MARQARQRTLLAVDPRTRHGALGSQVWIEFGQQRIVQLQLPPARAGLQALAGATDEF